MVVTRRSFAFVAFVVVTLAMTACGSSGNPVAPTPLVSAPTAVATPVQTGGVSMTVELPTTVSGMVTLCVLADGDGVECEGRQAFQWTPQTPLVVNFSPGLHGVWALFSGEAKWDYRLPPESVAGFLTKGTFP